MDTLAQQWYARECENCVWDGALQRDDPTPAFELGLERLGIQGGGVISQQIDDFVGAWFDAPLRFFPAAQQKIKISVADEMLRFPSLLNISQEARFVSHIQKSETAGRKVALIHLMHWDGQLTKYRRIIGLIRSSLLPISTLIYIPAGIGAHPGVLDPLDHESLSPRVSRVVVKAQQAITDLVAMARYLKEELGFEEVGVLSYSLGSMRGIIATVLFPQFFDFGIFHLVGDDFAEAVLEGVATQEVATRIHGHIDPQLLHKLWQVISPGAYAGYFSQLSDRFRFVQAKYDYVLGVDNVNRFNDKVRSSNASIELRTVPLSHTTLGAFPRGWGVMLENIGFVYRHTKMRESSLSRLFNA